MSPSPLPSAFLLLSSLCLLFCAACLFEPEYEEDVFVRFPELPAAGRARFGRPEFVVRYYRNGRLREIRGSPGVEEISLRLPLDASVPLLASPRFPDPAAVFSPAGGLYPGDLGADKKIRLTWAGGFAAETLQILRAAGFALEEFNCERFFREVEARGKNNPWDLDRKKIFDALGALSFRADKIVLRRGFPALLTVRGSGWFPMNLLAASPGRNEEGLTDFGLLTEGVHRYYSEAGGLLSIGVGAEGDLICRESGSGSELRVPSR